jgi:RHS repeat-associated protein
VDQRQYQWDEVYNKVGMADVRAAGPLLSHTFTYDSAYRMVRALVLNAIGPTRDTNYVFDDVNNRESVSGDPNCSGSYVLDPTLPSPGDFQANQYTSTPCDTRTHDENGNLLGTFVAGGSVLMTYDFKNRMVTYGNDATYSYDALGRRIGKSVVDETGVGVVTEYLYDEWRVCEERDDTDGVRRTFVYGLGIDEVLNMRSTDRDIYFVGDEQGSITAALEPGSGVVCRYTYGDYGQPSFFDGAGNPLAASATDNPYLFTGRRFDVESVLYNYRTRYLDPVVGRFTTRDTIGIWGDENNFGNGFAYVGNNPQTSVDPLGLEAVKWLNMIDWGDDGSDIYVDYFIFHETDYKIPGEDGREGIWTDHGNPNPEGGATGEAPDIVGFLEKYKNKVGGRWRYWRNIYSTPLGLILEDHGGLAPLVNPVPIDDIGRQWDGGGGGFGYNAGGIREQMERKKRQGRGKGDDDDDGDGGGKPPGDSRVGYYWDIGPSDLVNPHDHALLQLAVPIKKSISD